MHEGFVNFNAGTLGRSMVEGRVSQGVILGAGSDIGGGASIMGTLSGGGKERIRIGERALLGANSGALSSYFSWGGSTIPPERATLILLVYLAIFTAITALVIRVRDVT